ncbi:hypothetical protein [Streptomyces aureus]|uniref:hypothetical protein n=1 Tax=Streptomyces aureus TaxID=193461 RepID=UPI00055E84E9|nr:hypothetical protein [Streptomyces aureus]
MRSPAELDDVRWSRLGNALGPAEDVPKLIRVLYGDDEEAADEALHDLFDYLHHQGAISRASGPAVPFLAHAALHAPGRRDKVLVLLAVLAGHDPGALAPPRRPRIGSAAAFAELRAELRAVLPELLPCLGDPDRGVRRAALRTVAAVADLVRDELRSLVVERVEALYADDPVPAVRADALVLLDRFGRAPESLDSPLPQVRLAAAQLAAERSGPPYAAELVAVFTEDGAEPDFGEDDHPWSGTATQEQRITALLAGDPDAGLGVASRWIAAGDIGSRGSRLAGKVAEKWRDREREVLELSLAALPHTSQPASLLRTIAYWVECLPELDATLRDGLHRYATTADDKTAEHALHALVNARDPRALDLVLSRPAARLIAAAARCFPEAGDRLVPLIRRKLAAGAGDGTALIQALAPLGAAARAALPEVVDCLRTGRAAVAAARRLGVDGENTPEITGLLLDATRSGRALPRTVAAVAHFRLTGDPEAALLTYQDVLSSGGSQPYHHLIDLEPMGAYAAPLLPLVEFLLERGGRATREGAAEAHLWITGSPDRAVPALTALADTTGVGLNALKALAAVGCSPKELHPALRSYASSPERLMPDSPRTGLKHGDDELRTVSRRLLAMG